MAAWVPGEDVDRAERTASVKALGQRVPGMVRNRSSVQVREAGGRGTLLRDLAWIGGQILKHFGGCLKQFELPQRKIGNCQRVWEEESHGLTLGFKGPLHRANNQAIVWSDLNLYIRCDRQNNSTSAKMSTSLYPERMNMLGQVVQEN